MKNLIIIAISIFSFLASGQDLIQDKQFLITLRTFEKNTNDTIRASIVDVFSGNKRIKTIATDFDGMDTFEIKKKYIVEDKILLKVYGPKCVIFTKEYEVKNNINVLIPLEYGETDYRSDVQLYSMLNKLNLSLEPSEQMECGFEDLPVFQKAKVKN